MADRRSWGDGWCGAAHVVGGGARPALVQPRASPLQELAPEVVGRPAFAQILTDVVFNLVGRLHISEEPDERRDWNQTMLIELKYFIPNCDRLLDHTLEYDLK